MAPIALSEAVRVKLKDSFPAQDREQAETLLLQYGGVPAEPDAERVRLEILEASESRLEQMRELVTLAKTDFRDLLMLAEDRRRRSSAPRVPTILQLSACLIAGALSGYALASLIDPNAIGLEITPSSWRWIATLCGVVLGLAGYRALTMSKP